MHGFAVALHGPFELATVAVLLNSVRHHRPSRSPRNSTLLIAGAGLHVDMFFYKDAIAFLPSTLDIAEACFSTCR